VRLVVQVLLNAVGVLVTARLVPGISYRGGLASLLVAGVILGLLNVLVKPLVTLLSLPFIVLTLGLFFLVINGLILWVAAALLPSLSIDGCLPAILGGVVLMLFNWAVAAVGNGDR
jgi:putative membrane protein